MFATPISVKEKHWEDYNMYCDITCSKVLRFNTFRNDRRKIFSDSSFFLKLT